MERLAILDDIMLKSYFSKWTPTAVRSLDQCQWFNLDLEEEGAYIFG